MAKLSLTDQTNTYNPVSINENFARIEAEFQDKVLYRANPSGEPNTMSNSFDMNSNRILNLPAPISGSEAARLLDVQAAIGGGAANLITFDPTNGISATNVQGALQELDNEKMATSDLAASSGASLVGFDATLNYAVATIGAVIHDICINVKMFPWLAKGDGVTDDTAAIAAAQATLLATGGKLYFPRGTYLTDFINLEGYFNITLEGENQSAEFAFKPGSIIKIRSACSVGVRIVTPTDTTQVGPPAGAGAYIALRNLFIDANNLAQTGVNMSKAVTMENCSVRYALQDGIVFEAFTYPVHLKNVNVSYSGRHGLNIKSPGTTVYTLKNCEFTLNGGDGIYGVAGSTCTFDTVLCQSNAGNGFYFYRPDPATYADSGQVFLSRMTFISCYTEGNGGTGFLTHSYNENPLSFTGKIIDLTFIGCSLGIPSLNGCSTVTSIGCAAGVFTVNPLTSTTGLDFFDLWGSLNINGKGVRFPPTPIPSTDVNVLDAYAEGTFTPVVIGTTAAGTCTYATQTGAYTKIGRVVTFNLTVGFSSHTGTGMMRITGIPFAPALGTFVFPIAASNLGIPAGGSSPYMTLLSGTGAIGIIMYDLIGATVGADTIPMDTAATLSISGSYMAAV